MIWRGLFRTAFPKIGETFSLPDRKWHSQNFWRKSGSENIHQNLGPTRERRRTRNSSGRIRRVFTTFSRLIAGWWWSKKWISISFRELHSPSSRWTENQTVRTERRTILNSTWTHWRDQNDSYKLRCDVLEYRRKPRPVIFVDRVHTIHHIGRELPDEFTWSGSGWRRNKRHLGLTCFGQRHGKTCQKQRNEEVGYRKTEAWQR